MSILKSLFFCLSLGFPALAETVIVEKTGPWSLLGERDIFTDETKIVMLLGEFSNFNLEVFPSRRSSESSSDVSIAFIPNVGASTVTTQAKNDYIRSINATIILCDLYDWDAEKCRLYGRNVEFTSLLSIKSTSSSDIKHYCYLMGGGDLPAPYNQCESLVAPRCYHSLSSSRSADEWKYAKCENASSSERIWISLTPEGVRDLLKDGTDIRWSVLNLIDDYTTQEVDTVIQTDFPDVPFGGAEKLLDQLLSQPAPQDG